MNHFGPLSQFLNIPHRIRCKGLKGPRSRSVTEVTAAFSTSFFTALLKRVHHRWKHSCTTLISLLNSCTNQPLGRKLRENHSAIRMIFESKDKHAHYPPRKQEEKSKAAISIRKAHHCSAGKQQQRISHERRTTAQTLFQHDEVPYGFRSLRQPLWS